MNIAFCYQRAGFKKSRPFMKQLYYDPGLLSMEVISTVMLYNLVTTTPLVVDKRVNIVFYTKIFLFF